MRHFEQEEIAQRYAKYRPQVHGDIIETVARELSCSKRLFLRGREPTKPL